MRSRWRRAAAAGVLWGACGAAHAGPNGGTVVGGSATIQGAGSSSVTVNQLSQNAIINWATFNIGQGETATFNQPNSSAVALNRVVGGRGPSFLDGTLTANGRVFIVNGDGILFGPHSSITTAGFLATTNNIRDADFMAGNYNFSIPGNPSASIVNRGTITATSGGFAALVAPGVRSSGTITATLGTVSLASGNAFTLDFYGDRLITLAVNDQIASAVKDVQTGKTLKSLVKNTGKLSANGGRVELTAAAARAVVNSVINNRGVIEANSIGSRNGMIVLGGATGASKPKGAPTQTVRLSGTLSAAGKDKGTTGGTVVVSGENIVLAGATIDASGEAGGGHVLIGGDTGGGYLSTAAAGIELAKLESFTIPIATTVSVDATSVINASATGQGDGGKVVLWSDQQTTFAGTILAQGGASGDGGFAEISSHGSLSFSGTVDLSAPHGTRGTLLLDPLNATIDTNPGSEVITVSSIQNALLSGDVIVTTVGTVGLEPGDITVAAPVTWTTSNKLTLSAANNVLINAAITGANGGLTLSAGGAFPSSNGTITAIAPVAVGLFNLQGGAWTQITPNLPTFSAADFRITGGSFLRVLGGNGSIGTPYQIADVYGLQGVAGAALIPFLSNRFLNNNFLLSNNIDARVTSGWNGGNGFVPIGFGFGAGFTSFSGVFDGQGHTINGLTINATLNSLPGDTFGLFGGIGQNGIVRNVNLTNAAIVINRSGGGIVGVLAGTDSGTVINSSASGSVTVAFGPFAIAGGLVGNSGGSISQSYAAVSINVTNGISAGGLVGQNNNGTISQSYATGSVFIGGATSNGSPNAGGLVGESSGTISQSYATGSIVGGSEAVLGGLVGATSSGVISDSYATGSVSGGPGSTVGGLVGELFGAAVTVNQSFATGAVNGGGGDFGAAGGLVGANLFGAISQAYATGSVSGLAYNTGGTFFGVGSLVGLNVGAIKESYATGLVSGGANGNLGGLVGNNGTIGSTIPNSPAGSVSNSYWDTQSTGQANSAGGTGWTTAQLTGGLPAGFDPSVWTIISGQSYPYFPWQPANLIPFASISSSPPPAGPPANPTPPVVSLPENTPQQTGVIANLTLPGIDTRIANSTPPVVLIPTLPTTPVTISTGTKSTSTSTGNTGSQQLTWNAAEGIYVPSFGGKLVQVPPKKENLTGPLAPDCEATVFAMIGNLIAAVMGAPPPVSSSDNPYENSSGFANPTPPGAPPIQMVGGTTNLTVGAAGAPFGLPNMTLFSKNASLTNLTAFPAIIGGKIVTPEGVVPHFMLALGLDGKGNIIANDPLTGKQIVISPSGVVSGMLSSSGAVIPLTSGGEISTFKAVGFVGIKI